MSTQDTSATITAQPVGTTYLPGGEVADTAKDGGHVSVRYLQDTPEDAEFAARLMVEGFRGKYVHAVGEEK